MQGWGAGGGCLLLLLLHCLALAALADAGSKWGPDNPKPWVLKYQKYIGPFMAMCVHSPLSPCSSPPPLPASPPGRAGRRGAGEMSACFADHRPAARRLTFVILGGMILFICMYERKERKQWPFGPWDAKAAEKTAK